MSITISAVRSGFFPNVQNDPWAGVKATAHPDRAAARHDRHLRRRDADDLAVDRDDEEVLLVEPYPALHILAKVIATYAPV